MTTEPENVQPEEPTTPLEPEPGENPSTEWLEQHPVPDPTEGAPATSALEGMVDADTMAALRAKLDKFTKREEKGTTVSGSEAVEEPVTEGEVRNGKDVDWSEYDIEYNLKHLYPKSVYRDTPQGPKWVVMLSEFMSTEKDFRGHGKQHNTPYAADGVKEPGNIGEYLSDVLNSADGWVLVSMLPAGTGRVGILLRKEYPAFLPDPKRLLKATEVEAPADGELERAEDASAEFAASLGLTPAADPSEDLVGEPTQTHVEMPEGE